MADNPFAELLGIFKSTVAPRKRPSRTPALPDLPGRNNLSNWMAGGTRHRELEETRAAWAETQAIWRGSPLGQQDLSDLAFEFLRDFIHDVGRCPTEPVLAHLHAIAETLLREEGVGEVEPIWQDIEADAGVAVEFRKCLAHRRRYAADFTRIHGMITGQLRAGFQALLETLPDCCFLDEYGEEDDQPASFEVPLIELLEDPAGLIDQLILMPYTDDTIRLGLFQALRDTCQRNLVAASGLAATFDPVGHEHRIVVASQQKNMAPADLAAAYLAGTPFLELMELPIPFSVPEEARFEHCHIIGGTGHGKTQLMQRMIYGDLEAAQTERRSVVVIDSQGDLINRLRRLALFSSGAENSLAARLVVIDPADVEFPAALNLFDANLGRLDDYSAADRERVLNGVVELYETFFGALLGAELTQKQGVIFKYLARLMLTIPGATIHTLMRLMEDGKAFKPYMEDLEGSARYFFETEFFHPSFAATKKQILRRLWGVLSTPAFERMFAQPSNKLDLFEAMQDGKIILINTAKDLLKREGSQLFGQFFIAMLAQAALERSTVDPEDRTPTLVYVDEAQEYFGDDVETILAQARKYRVGLTLAHQTLDQLSPRLRSVLHANTSMKCVGGVSARDARAMADELHTSADFIESMKRRGGTSEFAVWIKHQTHQAIRLSVPLGFIERQPVLTSEEYDDLLARNRAAYCGTLANILLARPTVEPPEEPPPATPRPDRPRPPPPASALPPEPHIAHEVAPEVVRPAATERPPRPSEQGKGGSQHRYVQQLVKRMAEEYGFRAVIEEAVAGGQVDVGLHRDELHIACEVSITSSAEYELRNLAKCLGAGFSRVWAIAPDAKRQKVLRLAAETTLSAEEFGKVEFYTTDQMVIALDMLAAPDPEPSTVRGYKVSVRRTTISPEDAESRRAAIARIVAQSMRDSAS